MSNDELIDFLRAQLSLEVETESSYTGDMDGSGSLYKESHTIRLVLDGETISSISI